MNHPPNVDDMIRILLSGFRVSNNCASLSQWHIQRVCSIARSVFLADSMCLNIVAPVSIVGDIHGQFKDLLRIFKNKGAPPEQRYLFLGDYVDRGKNSVETITLLLCFKIKYPNDIFLLRGNHESATLNKTYGFFDECKRRFSIKLWKCFVDCYNCMPVAAIIENRIFCCHGGLSPELTDIDDINNIERPTEIPDSGILCDLLWSDPDRICGWGKSTRGVSFIFGSDVVDHFLARNDFDLICRGHQVVEDGYEFFAKRQLVTIFSAPNYCGIFDNAGAVMGIDANLRITFEIYKGKKVTVSTHVKTISATASSTVATHSTKSHISK